MIHTMGLIPSACQPLRLCTSQKTLSSSVSFHLFRLHLLLRVFLLVGNGNHSQRSRQTLNPQARAVLQLRPSDIQFQCPMQVLRFVSTLIPQCRRSNLKPVPDDAGTCLAFSSSFVSYCCALYLYVFPDKYIIGSIHSFHMHRFLAFSCTFRHFDIPPSSHFLLDIHHAPHQVY